MTKTFVIAWIALFVLWMAGDFAVHGLLLGADYANLQNLFRSPEDSQRYFPLMLLAHVMMAGAFAWIYGRGHDAARPWLGQGLRFGGAVALLTVVPSNTIYLVVQPMPVTVVIKQIVASGVLVLLLGALAAFLHRGAAR